MKIKLLSLQSCGESLEKALAIHYTSLFTNESFYSNYRTIIFFGHNLPKKNKKLNVHGTVGFYSQYLSDLSYIPYCTKNYFIDNINSILEMLCMKGIITERNWQKTKNNTERYWEFIRNIPFEYIYPDYYRNLIASSRKLLNIYELKPVYLERTWSTVFFDIDSEYYRYSIYALENDGHIGKYTTDGNNYSKLVRNLNRCASMSGNIAILLKEIGYRIDSQTIIGYRKDKRNIRPNKNYELNKLLNNHQSLIEPSNTVLSQKFDAVSYFSTEEEKTNYVYANVFRNFVIKNHDLLNL